MSDKIEIISGLQMPFYPMRPTTGAMVRTLDGIATITALIESGEWAIQPKLNGDRACLAVLGGKVYVQNRHGEWYSFAVTNRLDFLKLPDCTVLDGEVYEKVFYPFEALVVGGESLMKRCPTIRISAAKQACNFVGVEWKFETPTREWLVENFEKQPKLKVPVWEGIVRKRVRTNYVTLGSDGQESSEWFKSKWVK